MCGQPDTGGERIPSFNWYEDHDFKSLLGKDASEDANLGISNTTSKRLFIFDFYET